MNLAPVVPLAQTGTNDVSDPAVWDASSPLVVSLEDASRLIGPPLENGEDVV